MTIPSTGEVSVSRVRQELRRFQTFSMTGLWEKRLTKKNLHPYSFADFRGKTFLREPYSWTAYYNIADNNKFYFQHVGSNANIYWGGVNAIWSGYVGQIINEDKAITVGDWTYTPGQYRAAINNTYLYGIFRWRVTG